MCVVAEDDEVEVRLLSHCDVEREIDGIFFPAILLLTDQGGCTIRYPDEDGGGTELVDSDEIRPRAVRIIPNPFFVKARPSPLNLNLTLPNLIRIQHYLMPGIQATTSHS